MNKLLMAVKAMNNNAPESITAPTTLSLGLGFAHKKSINASFKDFFQRELVSNNLTTVYRTKSSIRRLRS